MLPSERAGGEGFSAAPEWVCGLIAIMVRRTFVTIAAAAVALTGTVPALAATTPAPGVFAARSSGALGPLTGLVIERLQISDKVAAAKFGTGQPIENLAREQQELMKVRAEAANLGLDPDATAQFFQDQFTASKTIQSGLFDRWAKHPEQVPASKPDLTEIRTQLDDLSDQLLAELAHTKDLRLSTPLCWAQLTQARVSGEVVNGFDRLHRRALAQALSSACEG